MTVVLFVLEMEWLLSTGQDKNFTWHCSESGQQLGTYRTAAWVSGLQYPPLLLCLLSLFAGYLALRVLNEPDKLPAKWSGVDVTK